MTLNAQQICLQVAEKLREIATRQGHVPFKTGDLRKAHVVEPQGQDAAILSANTPYARAVHDGRPAIVIRPKRGRALNWPGAAHPVKSVRQPARKGKPWMQQAVAELHREGLDFLAPTVGQQVADDLTKALRSQGLTVTKA